MIAAAIIVAAGKGKRFGAKAPKQFVSCLGKPLFLWSVLAFKKLRAVKQIVLVVPERDAARLQSYSKKYGITVVAGGKERTDSVKAGLAALDDSIGYVAIHDGARPLISPQLINKALHAAFSHKAAVVAVPARDTVKLSADGQRTGRTIPRSTVWLAQTPQVFKKALITAAYKRPLPRGITDDAQVAELAGHRAAIVEGDHNNIKVTERRDLDIAKLFFRRSTR